MPSDSDTARLLELEAAYHDKHEGQKSHGPVNGAVAEKAAYYDSQSPADPSQSVLLALRVLLKSILLLTLRIPRQGYQWTRARLVRLPTSSDSLSTPSSSKGAARPAMRSTAWLDGVRGCAAVLVFMQHHETGSRPRGEYNTMEMPWGAEGRYMFVTMPIIREIFNGGNFSIALFFSISGFVVAYKPLQLIHAYRHDVLAKTVASSVFRRWPRLYLPSMAMQFLWLSSWHLFGIVSAGSPGPQPTYWGDLKLWAWANLVEGDAQHFSRHLWTIRVEFYASLLVLFVLMAISGLTANARLFVMTFLLLYRSYLGQWDALFILGMLICELTLLADANQLPGFLTWYKTSRTWTKLWIFTLFAALYLAQFTHSETLKDPDAFYTIPGGAFITALQRASGFPEQHRTLHYRCWAAILVLTAIPRVPRCKAFFESSIPQFLGRISFSFYLVHGPILWSIGVRVYTLFGLHWSSDFDWYEGRLRLPRVGPRGMELNFVIPLIFNLATSLILANYFARTVEDASVRWVNKLHAKISREDKPPVLPSRGSS